MPLICPTAPAKYFCDGGWTGFWPGRPTGKSGGLTNNKHRALSWKGLIEDGFEYGTTKGKISAAQKKSWQTQLDSADIDDVLGAAEFMSRKLDAPDGDLYGRWLENVFKGVNPEENEMADAVRALQTAGVPISTLNYDPLLERVTGLPGITFGETAKVASWMRRESRGILHLHGSWDQPATCILGIPQLPPEGLRSDDNRRSAGRYGYRSAPLRT